MDEEEFEYNPEVPNGYAEALDKYPAFVEDSISDIWHLLALWREYEQGSRWIKKKIRPEFQKEFRDKDKRIIEQFKARILKAILEDDKVYLVNLFKALKAPTEPRDLMNCIKAAIEAFDDLFFGLALISREDWPTKQEIRRKAEEILRKAGRPLPSERHWPRIFKQAGLSELLSVTYGRGRKRASRTK